MTLQLPFSEVEVAANVYFGPGTPEYFAFWKSFAEAVDGQSFTYRDADDRITQYAKDGHRIGRLFRPLPCMREKH